MTRFSEQRHILQGSRVRARRRLLVKVILWWTVALIVVGGGIYGLIKVDAFFVKEVYVEGVRLADHEKMKEALVAAVMRPPRSWVAEDITLFWLFLDPPEVFLAAFPMFRDVTVATDLFAREVVIRVEERELYGVWCLAGGDCYAFDRDGMTFGRAPQTVGTLITKVSDIRTKAFWPGEAVLATPEWRARMFSTLRIIDTLHLSHRMVTVRDEALREWDVALAEGPTLRFSFAFVPERLEDALTSLSRRGDFRTLTHLDFRVPDRLYYK